MSTDAFWQAVDEFNQQQFYACHDTLEALWLESIELNRNFYQGILQIAVGCYHMGNHNSRGAVILLGEGIKRLSVYQPDHESVDVTQLIRESATLLKQLQRIEPQEVEAFLTQLEKGEGDFRLPKIVKTPQ